MWMRVEMHGLSCDGCGGVGPTGVSRNDAVREAAAIGWIRTMSPLGIGTWKCPECAEMDGDDVQAVVESRHASRILARRIE
jgi:hypothetical protein